jgi:hypothetical protein
MRQYWSRVMETFFRHEYIPYNEYYYIDQYLIKLVETECKIILIGLKHYVIQYYTQFQILSFRLIVN